MCVMGKRDDAERLIYCSCLLLFCIYLGGGGGGLLHCLDLDSDFILLAVVGLVECLHDVSTTNTDATFRCRYRD